MASVLITGATGFLGYHLIKTLLETTDLHVIAIKGRPEDKTIYFPEETRLNYFSLDDLFSREFGEIETVINCAFARSSNTGILSGVFDFTEKAIQRFEKLNVKSAINISSQGVYKRLPQGHLSNEDSPIEPIDVYSLAKYASEKIFQISSIPYVTNVRLASLNMPQRFIYSFVSKAVRGESFTVTAPNQYASIMDVEDAAMGLTSIILLHPEKRASIYNLGTGSQYSILEYAECVRKTGEILGYNVEFDIQDNQTTVCAGMDCRRIKQDTGWEAIITKEEMIANLFKEISHV